MRNLSLRVKWGVGPVFSDVVFHENWVAAVLFFGLRDLHLLRRSIHFTSTCRRLRSLCWATSENRLDDFGTSFGRFDDVV